MLLLPSWSFQALDPGWIGGLFGGLAHHNYRSSFVPISRSFIRAALMLTSKFAQSSWVLNLLEMGVFGAASKVNIV